MKTLERSSKIEFDGTKEPLNYATNEKLQRKARLYYSKRKKIRNRFGRMVVPRVFSLEPEEIEELRTNSKDGFINPYKRKKGVYASLIEAMHILGISNINDKRTWKWHSLWAIKNCLVGVMSHYPTRNKVDAWTQFFCRLPKSKESRKVDNKIRNNLNVMRRQGGLYPYGFPLTQCGMCLDVVRVNGKAEYFRLMTGFKRPEDVSPVILDLTGKEKVDVESQL